MDESGQEGDPMPQQGPKYTIGFEQAGDKPTAVRKQYGVRDMSNVAEQKISLRTLNMMDTAMKNLNDGVVSEPIDLTERFDIEDEED